jgi:hypothetical protein
MAETAIKSNEREAARLFQRGVAAARGGQRRVAAGLLSRAVQLDPRHELGWLWLSGVLDEPGEIAFCLRSALTVNPQNERARQGLAWLEQRGLLADQTADVVLPAPRPLEEQPNAQRETHHEADSWWVGWRRTRRDMSRAWVVGWSFAILILLLTLSLNITFRQAVKDRDATLKQTASAPTLVPTSPPPALPAILQVELPVTRDAQVLAYLSAIDAPRARLREAVTAYQGATNQPGGSSSVHASAARKLRQEVEAAYSLIEGITPPAPLAKAHANYLAGLELERSALDDMLEFYGSFSIQLANRAALRMEEADKHLERARVDFGIIQARTATHTIHVQVAR